MRIGQWTFSTPRNEGDRQGDLNKEGYAMNEEPEPGLTLVISKENWGDELPPKLVDWALVYFDYLINHEGEPPEPPPDFVDEATQLVGVLHANYGYVLDKATNTANECVPNEPTVKTDPDPGLAACVSVAQPAASRALGDSDLVRHVFGWFKRARKSIEATACRRTDALAGFLSKTRGTTPLLGTVVATVLAPIAGSLLLIGQPGLAGVAMVLLAAAELIDSALAKRSKNARCAVLVDQIADRFSDVALLGAVALWGFQHDIWTGWAAMATLAAALIGSYVWAMTAALRLPPPQAHVGRAERIVAITVGIWLTPLYPVGALRIAVFFSAAAALVALSERSFHAVRAATAPEPQWLGAHGASWARSEFIPRLVEQLHYENGRLVVVEVHTTGEFHGPSQPADVVAVIQKRGKQVCVEYFHPAADPGEPTPAQQRASNE